MNTRALTWALAMGTAVSTACAGKSDDASVRVNGAVAQSLQAAAESVPNTADVEYCAARANAATFETWGTCPPLTYAQSDPARRCYEHRVGQCRILDCRSSVYKEWRMDDASEGTVTISSGASYNTWTVNSQRKSKGAFRAYELSDAGGPGWQPGDTVRFTATGGDLPGFDLSVPFVGYAHFLQPDLSAVDDHAVALARNAPFTITWEPTTDWVILHLFQQRWGGWKPPEDALAAWCTFDASLGTGTIPAEVLQLYGPDLELATETTLFEEHARFVEQSIGNRTLRAVTASWAQRKVLIQ